MEKKSDVDLPDVANDARPNVVEAWLLAARPKTLAAASVPVAVGLALAWRDLLNATGDSAQFLWVPAICCLGFALLAQVAANFVNDYADYKKGCDGAERLGPARAVASGWIAPRAMFVGTFVVLGGACCFGLVALPYGGMTLIWVGLISCVFCLLYSAGPKPLSHIGLGDVLVVVFFGFVAVCFTFFLQTKEISFDSVLVGLAIGFATDNILVANNYRDRDEDRANRKYTLIAILGERFGRWFYFLNGCATILLLAIFFTRRDAWNALPVATLVVYFFVHFRAWRTLSRIRSGKGLVRVLALSSKNLTILGVMLVLAFTCSQ